MCARAMLMHGYVRPARDWVVPVCPEFITNSVFQRVTFLRESLSIGHVVHVAPWSGIILFTLNLSAYCSNFPWKCPVWLTKGSQVDRNEILESYCIVIFDDRPSCLYAHVYVWFVRLERCRHRHRKSLSTFPIGQKFRRAPWLRTGSTLRETGTTASRFANTEQ